MKKFILFVCALLIGVSVSGQKTYKVGDYYNENGKEGVVFWVDESGEHGKIVSLKESKKSLKWASSKKEYERRIGTDNRTDGEKNMAIVRQIPGWKRKYPAFAWCEKLGEGWYLPAVEELEILLHDCHVVETLNKKLEEHGGDLIQIPVSDDVHVYHSSTENDIEAAMGLSILSSRYVSELSYGLSYLKYDPYLPFVRAISKF